MYTASQRAYSLYSTINKITEKLTREDLNLHAHLKLLVSEEQPYNYPFCLKYSLSFLKLFCKQSRGAKLLLFFGDFMIRYL